MNPGHSIAEQQCASLKIEIADVRNANETLARALAETRQDRDAYRHERDDHQQTASLVPDLRLELAKCKAQLEGHTVEVQQYCSSSIRMPVSRSRRRSFKFCNICKHF